MRIKYREIGAGFVPDVLVWLIIDEIAMVDNDDAFIYPGNLASLEGILAGISCGAAVETAARIAQKQTMLEK